MSPEQVVLEEVMVAALDSARSAAEQAATGDSYSAGKVDAYYDVLDVLKEQAELLGVKFDDVRLQRLNLDELFQASVKKATAA